MKAENRKPGRQNAVMFRYLQSTTEDYVQVVDHISVPDRFSYLLIMDRSCCFGFEANFS